MKPKFPLQQSRQAGLAAQIPHLGDNYLYHAQQQTGGGTVGPATRDALGVTPQDQHTNAWWGLANHALRGCWPLFAIVFIFISAFTFQPSSLSQTPLQFLSWSYDTNNWTNTITWDLWYSSQGQNWTLLVPDLTTNYALISFGAGVQPQYIAVTQKQLVGVSSNNVGALTTNYEYGPMSLAYVWAGLPPVQVESFQRKGIANRAVATNYMPLFLSSGAGNSITITNNDTNWVVLAPFFLGANSNFKFVVVGNPGGTNAALLASGTAANASVTDGSHSVTIFVQGARAGIDAHDTKGGAVYGTAALQLNDFAGNTNLVTGSVAGVPYLGQGNLDGPANWVVVAPGEFLSRNVSGHLLQIGDQLWLPNTNVNGILWDANVFMIGTVTGRVEVASDYPIGSATFQPSFPASTTPVRLGSKSNVWTSCRIGSTNEYQFGNITFGAKTNVTININGTNYTFNVW